MSCIEKKEGIVPVNSRGHDCKWQRVELVMANKQIQILCKNDISDFFYQRIFLASPSLFSQELEVVWRGFNSIGISPNFPSTPKNLRDIKKL